MSPAPFGIDAGGSAVATKSVSFASVVLKLVVGPMSTRSLMYTLTCGMNVPAFGYLRVSSAGYYIG